MVAITLLSIELGAPAFVHAQTATLRGLITDQSNGQPLQGVNITLDHSDGDFLGTITDGDGIFVITRIQPKQYRLRASFIGYETFTDTLDFADGGTQTINISLTESQAEMDALVVETERESGAARLTAGLQSVRPEDIDLVPTPDVSGDLVTYLTAMPGVVSTGDRGGQLFVRGGEPSHNLTMLDGMYLYQPFHILGFYSAYPTDFIQNADVYAGGFGSRYSGRIASVIDVQTRNGNKRSFDQSLSFSPFVSSATVEGPFVKDHISFLTTARVSAIEQLASQYIDDPLPYTFGDVFGKMHARISTNHQLSISALYTYDRGSLDPLKTTETDEIRWTNRALGLRYLILPGALPMRGEVLISTSHLDSELGPRDEPSRTASVGGFNGEVNMVYYSGSTQVDWGFFIRSPDLIAELDGVYQNVDFNFNRSTNVGAYAEPEFQLGSSMRARIGVLGHLVGDSGFFVEPRTRLIWTQGIHQVSAAAGLYHQNLVGVSDRRDATNVFTAWVEPTSDNLPKAIHGLVGYRVTPQPWLELSVEGFYKSLSDLFIAEWTAFPRLTTRLQQASGRAKGLDLRLEIRRPSFYAFLNYGLSDVSYDAMQESLLIWFGTESLTFRPPHDRRHQVNALFSTTIKGFDLSVRWNFGSGLPYNQVRAFDGFVLLDGLVDVSERLAEARVIYDRPFGGILPTYHRLDASVSKQFAWVAGSLVTIQGSILNAYDHANLFAFDIFTLRRINQLPFIPTLGIKIEL